MKKALSLCIAMAIMFGLFSSCANPPWSKTPADETLPRPADHPSEENTNAEPDPVDLSGLAEDELGKINAVLLDTLKELNKDDTVSVTLYLHEAIESSEVRDLALERADAAYIKTPGKKTTYNQAVGQIFDEIHTPILEDVIADYGIKVPHDIFITKTVPCISDSLVCAQAVVDMAKDERVRTIQKSAEEYEDAVSIIEDRTSKK